MALLKRLSNYQVKKLTRDIQHAVSHNSNGNPYDVVVTLERGHSDYADTLKYVDEDGVECEEMGIKCNGCGTIYSTTEEFGELCQCPMCARPTDDNFGGRAGGEPMPKMTAKYAGALAVARREFSEVSAWPDQEALYTRLQEAGHFWDSQAKRWEYFEPAEADDPTPLIMVRVWADGEIIQEAVDDLVNLVKRSKLPWDLIEKSNVYGCRPPKQREGRIYLKFLPRRGG